MPTVLPDGVVDWGEDMSDMGIVSEDLYPLAYSPPQ
jgi:hypothetical protein